MAGGVFKRNRARLARAMVLGVLAGGVPGSVRAEAPTVIKMASPVPEGSSWHTILREMAEKWSTASGGRVTLRIYPGQTMGEDPDVIRKMRGGSLQAALLAGAGYLDPSVYSLQIPMMYSSYEELDYVLDKLAPTLEKRLEATGFVVLHWTDVGWVRFFCQKPVVTPDELKAQRLFGWAGDNDVLEIYKAAGFSLVPLASAEASSALQTGLVTAMPASPQTAVILQWYNHARNMTDVKWALQLGTTVISKPAWERIPPELRPALLQVSREAGRRLRDESRHNEERDIESMRKRGMTVVHVDAKAKELWRKAAEAAYPMVRGKLVPVEIFDEARRYRDEFRRRSAAGR